MASSRYLVYLLLFVFIVAAAVDCNSEVDALTAWKSELVDPKNVLQSWDPTLVNPCTWFHITCNSENRVTRVDLGNSGLSGPLVPELANLPYLQYLYVYGNNISGVIPWEIGRLANLRSLGLYQNRLTGSIPPSLGNLTSLWFLEVFDNYLSGSIPTSLGALTSLRTLRLDNNNLSGTIPVTVLQLVRWGNLNLLNVSGNSLAGSSRPANSSDFAVTTIIQDPQAHE